MMPWSLLLAACTAGTDTGTGGVVVESTDAVQQACDACDGACVEEFAHSAGAEHTHEDVHYSDPPPTSGAHDACWAEFGVHDTPVEPRHWVHNLEHGGVVYLYNCPDGCADDVATLEGLVAASDGWALLTAYPDLPTRFAAVAWENRLLMDCADADTLQAFFTSHVNQAPESTNSGPSSSCETSHSHD